VLGTDIVKIERIKAAIGNEKFLTKVFCESEIKRYMETGGKAETLAGFFAAKEAVSKALGTGFRGFGLTDIEIIHDASGAPAVIMHNGAKEKAAGGEISVSISHDGGYATAVAILLK
jgi:phosphopantetheine--protein transferase-like protein